MSKGGKYSTLTKNMMLFTISSFGSKIISFLLVPLYTSVLSTQDYGTVDLMTTTAQLLIPVLTLNIQDAVLRFALDKNNKREDVFKVSFYINVVGGFILAAALLFLCGFRIIKIDSLYLVFLFVSFFFGSLNNSLQMYLKANDKVLILTIGGIINTLIACSLNLLLLLVFKWGVNGYMVANSVGLIIFDIYAWLAGDVNCAIRIGKRNNSLFKAMIIYSTPLIANSLAWWVNSASDRYILTGFRGTGENGIYSVSYKIPTILSTITGIFYNAWSISAITEFDKNDNDGFIGSTYSAYSMLSVLACSSIMILNIPIARILYAKDFFQAWRCVPFLLAGTAFNGLSLFEGCIFGAVKRTGDVSKSTIFGACVNTGLNFLLIFFYGAIGAAAATMIGYIASFGMRTYKMKDIIHMKTKWKKHYLCYALLVLQAFIGLNSNGWVIEILIFILMFLLYKEYFGLMMGKVLNKFQEKMRRH